MTANQQGSSGSATPDIVSAQEFKRIIDERKAAKASEEMRKLAEAERTKNEVLAAFQGPLERTPAQAMRMVMDLIRNAVEMDQTEVMAYRFPNALCTDSGRAVNNMEPGWEATLTGRPRAVYEFWRDNLKPLGYKLKANVIEFPNGMLGDIGFFLDWQD